MKPLSYEARTQIPNAAAIERIVSSVIAEAQHAQRLGYPDWNVTLPQSVITRNMAREIKRRLSAAIRVEVDLVITGTTDDADDGSAAPAELLPHMQRTIKLLLNPAPHKVERREHFTNLPDFLRTPVFFGSFPGPI